MVMTAEEKASELEAILRSEERNYGHVSKELTSLRDMQFKQNENLHALKRHHMDISTAILCMYVCTYVCIMYVCIMYVCMQVCMYVCMHVYLHFCPNYMSVHTLTLTSHIHTQLHRQPHAAQTVDRRSLRLSYSNSNN